MTNFSVNYSQLNEELAERKVYRLADVQDRVEKVAWDVVRFVDSDNIDNLWKIEHRGDDDVIVSMYDNEESLEITASEKSKNFWAAALDKSGSYVNIFYKNEPIRKISLSSLGIAHEDGKILVRNLPKMLVSNLSLVKNMIKDASKEERNLLFSKYPELKK